MINPQLFTVERILAVFLDRKHYPHNWWMREAEILSSYRAQYPQEGVPTKCVIRWRDWFLRYSEGPLQGHFWDIYGDDYQSPELALLALHHAPVPPGALDLKPTQ